MALADGLIGYWSPWLGSSGYRLLDRTGRGNHGTLTNMDAGTDWVGSTIRGRSGYVLDFDGSDDHVNVGNRGVYGFDFSSQFTLSAWIKTTGTSGGIIGKRVFAGWYMAIERANVLGLSLQGTSSAVMVNSVASGISDGNWHLVQATYIGNSNASGISLFVDGRAVSTTTVLNSAVGSMTNAIDVCIGSITTNAFRFTGQIGEVAVWNRVLRLAENLDLYRVGSGWYKPIPRSRFGFVPTTGVRRRRILCGDYS